MFFIATYYDSNTAYVLYNPRFNETGIWPEGYFCCIGEVLYRTGGLLTFAKLGTLERV